MPSWKRVIVSGSDAALNSLLVTNGITGSLLGTASYADYATSASYALNGGVTQLLAGPNVILSPTNGLGQVTVSATLSGSTIFNTATGSYGSFYDTTTQTNPVADVPRSMSFNSTDITNGVSISGSTSPFNTYIKTQNAGVYDIQFSAQLDKTDSGTDEIVIWLRKNGTDLTDSATTLTLTGNNDKQVAAWNWFVQSAANDYYQIIWRSLDTDLRLLAEPISGTHPGIPSVIATVNRVDQFLSNTGSFSGSFTGTLQGTSSYATQALSSSYALSASHATSTAAVAGTTNYVSKFTSGTAIGNSQVFDNGTNVGIGTTSPPSKLSVLPSNDDGIALTDGSNNVRGLFFVNNVGGTYSTGLRTSNYWLDLDASGAGQNAIRMFTGTGGIGTGTERMRITAGGNVGIGTTSPNAKLDVSGSAIITGSLVVTAGITGSLQGTASYATQALSSSFATTATTASFLNGGTNGFIQNGNSFGTTATLGTNDNNSLQFETNNSTRMFISSSGDVGIGTVSPTARLHISASGALSSNIALRVRNSANTGDLLSVAGNGSTILSDLTATGGISIAAPSGLYYPTLAFSNNGGAAQGSIFGYNSKLNISSTRITPGNTLSVNFSYFDANYAQLEVLAKSALSTDNALAVVNSAVTGYHLKVTNAGNVQTGVGGLSIPRTDTPNGSLLSTITYTTGAVTRFSTAIETPGGLYGSTTTDTSILALSLGYYGIGLRCNGGSATTGFTFNTIVATTGTYFMRMQNGATDLFTILTSGSIGISNSAPKYKLDVSGSARISGETNTSISSSLVVYGSGSAQPVFTVQGSQGELFSVTDSLTGSLFSVNDISGLPILETFSDNTILMGSYLAPVLNTTVRTTLTNSGSFNVYSMPTASYDGAFYEYVAKSGSNARAGNIMATYIGTTASFAETTTTDIGNTSTLNFTVLISGSNLILTGSVTTANWNIKTIIKTI